VSADRTVEKVFVVRSELGLHARPAGRLASVAGRFDAEITLGRGDEWVSGSSVLSILCLAATQGTALRVRAIGVDAEEAVTELGVLIESLEADLKG
jgi:PTS hybrid protein